LAFHVKCYQASLNLKPQLWANPRGSLVNRFAGIRPLLSLYNYNQSATFIHMSLRESPFVRLRLKVLVQVYLVKRSEAKPGH